MAITRAQQARQMLKNAGAVEQDGVMNYIKNSESVTVPKEFKARSNAPATKLAYITADEAKMLKKEKPGTPHKGPKGIPSYDSFDAQGGYTSGEAMSAAERGDIAGAQREGMSRDDARDVRAGAVAAGAGARDSDDADIEKRAKEIKEAVEKRKREAAAAITKEEKKEARRNYKEIQKRLKRDRFVRQQRLKGILSGAKKFSYKDPITGETIEQDLNPFGLTDTELEDMKAYGLSPEDDIGLGTPDYQGGVSQDLVDQFLEKSDKFSGAEMEAFKEKFNMPNLPGAAGVITKLFEPVFKKGSKFNKDFFTDKVLGAGKFTYKGQTVTPEMFEFLSPTEMQEIYGDYMDRRQRGEIDAYGGTELSQNAINARGGPGEGNNPILPIIPKPSDPVTNPVDPRTNFYGLTPRIGGSIFDFSGFEDGGRVAAMDGGIMDVARQGLFLGGTTKGIKKGLKSVTRGIKKVAKSPLGKIALAAAAGGYGFGLGPFTGMKGAGFLKSAGVKNFLFKKGIPGIKNLSNKGLFSIIGGASLLPLLMGQKEEEEFDIEDYYAKNRLNTNAQLYNRIIGSDFAFAEGGDVEPVAKKTMPLLDMGGQEMDLRAEGGFVPIGRMEKADDVPARLSKNEFVFTADAVRNAGAGDVDKGAEVMYNMMKNLESGGEVSEESQGLEGAREMFQTSKRLEEVL